MEQFASVLTKGVQTTFEEQRERAILVGVDRPNQKWSLDSSLAELERLVDTAGADTVAKTTQKLESPNPRTFVGTGKAEEIAQLARSYAADLVIFDDELTPSQQSNLEKTVDKSVKIIDLTALILDIFALHASSKEGRLQVRLAQNQYLYPRLRGMWAHLASNRMGGGVGSRFGEGESQLEVDRRMVRKRITSIKRELAHLADVRSLQREERYSSGMFRVALAGYTNAGKSSLINRLCDADVLSYDKLFATLDSTTRKFELPEGREITVTDTVGFIQKLPTTLVEASSSEREGQRDAVDETLEQIGAQSIPRIEVFNKCDLLSDEDISALKSRYPQAIAISAATGEGVEELVKRIAQAASAADTHMSVLIPYAKGALVAKAHERCHIVSETHEEQGTAIAMFVPQSYISAFQPYLTNDETLQQPCPQ